MGEHEIEDAVRPWWARAWGQIRYRAKAFASGLVVLLAGEVVLLLGNADFQQAVHDVLPAEVAPFLPLAIAFVVGIITHAIPNASAPGPLASGEGSE